jgi:hypothetical protein
MMWQTPFEALIDRRGNPLRSMARRATKRIGLMAAACVLGAAGFGYLLHAAHHGLSSLYGTPVAGLIMGGVLLLAAATVAWLASRKQSKPASQDGGLPAVDSSKVERADMLAGAAFALAFVVARQWSQKSRR